MTEHLNVICLTIVILALLAHRGWCKFLCKFSEFVQVLNAFAIVADNAVAKCSGVKFTKTVGVDVEAEK